MSADEGNDNNLLPDAKNIIPDCHTLIIAYVAQHRGNLFSALGPVNKEDVKDITVKRSRVSFFRDPDHRMIGVTICCAKEQGARIDKMVKLVEATKCDRVILIHQTYKKEDLKRRRIELPHRCYAPFFVKNTEEFLDAFDLEDGLSKTRMKHLLDIFGEEDEDEDEDEEEDEEKVVDEGDDDAIINDSFDLLLDLSSESSSPPPLEPPRRNNNNNNNNRQLEPPRRKSGSNSNRHPGVASAQQRWQNFRDRQDVLNALNNAVEEDNQHEEEEEEDEFEVDDWVGDAMREFEELAKRQEEERQRREREDRERRDANRTQRAISQDEIERERRFLRGGGTSSSNGGRSAIVVPSNSISSSSRLGEINIGIDISPLIQDGVNRLEQIRLQHQRSASNVLSNGNSSNRPDYGFQSQQQQPLSSSLSFPPPVQPRSFFGLQRPLPPAPRQPIRNSLSSEISSRRNARELSRARAQERMNQTQLRRTLQTVSGDTTVNMAKKREESVGIPAMCITAEGNTCMICMEFHVTTMCLPCTHQFFCFDCINTWKEGGNGCPFCKASILTLVQPITSINVNDEHKKRERDPEHLESVIKSLESETKRIRKRKDAMPSLTTTKGQVKKEDGEAASSIQ